MRKKRNFRLPCILLAVILAAGMIFSGSGTPARAGSTGSGTNGAASESTTSEEMSKAAQELEDAQGNASALESQRKSAAERLSSLEGLQSDAAAYLEALDANLAEVQQEADELEEQLAEKEEQIEKASARLEEAQEDAADQYEDMKLRIQYMYEAGETRYLDILFEADGLVDFLTRAEYIQEIISYDREMLDRYEETCALIADAEETLEEQYAELEQLQAENEEAQEDLQALMDAKSAEMESYTVQISTVSSELDEYTKAIAQQESLMKQIEAEIARQEEEERLRQEEEARRLQEEEESRLAEEGETGEEGAASSGSGSSSGSSGSTSSSTSFIWPLPTSNNIITSYFGSRESPTEGASSNHQGIDISASTGTKIYAAAGGTVVISQYSVSAGYYIMINHGNGVYTVYMHCSQLLVSVGDKVSQGDNIALVGSTGYSTGPHLHFGVRIDGVYVNPLNYLTIP